MFQFPAAVPSWTLNSLLEFLIDSFFCFYLFLGVINLPGLGLWFVYLLQVENLKTRGTIKMTIDPVADHSSSLADHPSGSPSPIFVSEMDFTTMVEFLSHIENLDSYQDPADSQYDGFVSWIKQNTTVAAELAHCSSRLFLQDNWTGPVRDMDKPLSLIPSDLALKILGEAEPAYRLCRSPQCLLVSIVLLQEIVKLNPTFANQYELLKAHWMRQSLLEEKSAMLAQKTKDLIESLEQMLTPDNDVPVPLRIDFLLTSCNVTLFYTDFATASRLLEKAKGLSKASSILTGILGKRTRFQETEYAQLVLEIQNAVQPTQLTGNTITLPEEKFPVDLPLDDDTLLNQAALSTSQSEHNLSDHESAVLLVDGLVGQRRRARTGLEDEELLAYINVVLNSSNSFAVRTSALFSRSKLEGDNRRRTLRAMSQFETLMNAFKSETGSSSGRLPFALAVNIPPFWKVEEALGFTLLKNGCTKEAINIFTGLELWEDVVECYQRIGQKVKAEDLIMKELAKNETGSMWCRLGDIREDAGCYEKAWEVSKHRSFRSRRDLGKLLLKRKEYEGARDALKQGLEANGIDSGAWFSLGYCHMKTGDFAAADQAFRRCVNLEPENALAWNNIASIALKNQDYKKAYRILQDSLKQDYNSWNVWDNYQNACQQVKDFEGEINAFHRLLELTPAKLNAEALGFLVVSVTTGEPDINESSAKRLLPKVKELFGAVTAKVPDNLNMWYWYAKLNICELADKPDIERKETLEQIVQKLQKAYRYAIQEKDWEREDRSVSRVLEIVKELACHQILLINELTDDVTARKAVQSSCRVMLDNVIGRVKKGRDDVVTGSVALPENMKGVFDELLTMRTSTALIS